MTKRHRMIVMLEPNNFSLDKFPLKVNSITQIHLTIVNKIMSSHKRTYRLFH